MTCMQDKSSIRSDSNAQPNLWQTRAAVFELLALSFAYPTVDLSRAVVSGEWADAARELSATLGIAMPDGWDEGLASYSGKDEDEALHTLRVEATRLLVGAPEPVVWPYEGVWRAQDEGVKPLLYVNSHSMEVERIMKACGLGRPEGTNDPIDRVDTELEFMEWLCLAEAGLARPSDEARVPDGGWARTLDEFWGAHANVWMPRFSQSVMEKAKEPFYRSAARLLSTVFESQSAKIH